MKNLFFALILVVFIIVGFTSNRRGKNDHLNIPSAPNEKITGEGNRVVKAQVFNFPDYDGRMVSSLDFVGKVLVVNSWAVWCPFCKDELNDFAKLQEEFEDEIIVVAIDRAESLAKAKGFTDSALLTDKMIFLLDAEDSFYKSIGGIGMPETIFVDRNGKIVSELHKRGPMKLDEMREIVEKVINS